MATDLICCSIYIFVFIRDQADISIVVLLREHIPRPSALHIKMRDDIIYAKGSYPSCIIDILKDTKDQIECVVY